MYKDDSKNFPDATDDSVCTGEHTPTTLASEAATKIQMLEENKIKLVKRIEQLEQRLVEVMNERRSN